MWLFFRNDDLGWKPKEFARLVTLFARHDQKLNAAAIPSLVSEAVIQESIPYSYQAAPYLQVVTHGYRHENYQNEMEKKAEYGKGRSIALVKKELEEGRRGLESRFENYFPCFVPPWNRFSEEYLPLLSETGYRMLSRDGGSYGHSGISPVPEFDICLDLHTAKGGKRLSAKEIFAQLAARHEAGQDFSGVMLHHCKMTDEDFATLDGLLKEISKRGIASCFFSDLSPGSERRCDIGVTHV
jgi:hypothetical protein